MCGVSYGASICAVKREAIFERTALILTKPVHHAHRRDHRT